MPKVVVVTGAAHGIGLATAKKFLSERWRVAYGTSKVALMHMTKQQAVAQGEGCGCAENVLRKLPAVEPGNSLRAILSALKARFLPRRAE